MEEPAPPPSPGATSPWHSPSAICRRSAPSPSCRSRGRCGIAKGRPVLDLDYEEDSTAEADANFVFTSGGGIVEIQGTAEQKPFAEQDFLAMLALARKGCAELAALQRQVLGGD